MINFKCLLLCHTIATRVMKETLPIGKGREHFGGRQTSRGLRPFQRGIIWSITSVKYLYNDLILRYGAVDIIPIHHGDNAIFKCLAMDRLSYTV